MWPKAVGNAPGWHGGQRGNQRADGQDKSNKRGVEPEVPARAFARLIDAEEPPRALYYRGAKPARHSRQVNRKNADRLWNLSEQLSGAHREEAKT